MADTAYYLVDDSSNVITLPAALYGGIIGTERKAIDEETEEGERLIYRQSSRAKFVYNYLLLADDLQILRDLHEAVNGDATAFRLVPSLDQPSVDYLVRKQSEFEPREIPDAAVVDGETVSVFEISLELLEEVATVEILP